MSVSTALATTAAVQSSLALIEAQEAKATACRAVLDNFNPATSSVEGKQAYAECVHVLYPPPISAWTDGEVLMLKATILCGLIGLIVGLYKGYTDDVFREDIGWAMAIGALYCVSGTLAPVVLYGLVWCIRFLIGV